MASHNLQHKQTRVVNKQPAVADTKQQPQQLDAGTSMGDDHPLILALKDIGCLPADYTTRAVNREGPSVVTCLASRGVVSAAQDYTFTQLLFASAETVRVAFVNLQGQLDSLNVNAQKWEVYKFLLEMKAKGPRNPPTPTERLDMLFWMCLCLLYFEEIWGYFLAQSEKRRKGMAFMHFYRELFHLMHSFIMGTLVKSSPPHRIKRFRNTRELMIAVLCAATLLNPF